MNGIQEVSGSNPLISTRKLSVLMRFFRVSTFYLFYNFSCFSTLFSTVKIYHVYFLLNNKVS